MRIRARHYQTTDHVDVLVAENRIVRISPPDLALYPDLVGGWVAPAFFDLQINGCMGFNFSSASLTGDEIYRIVATCREHGIAALCPTLITSSTEALVHGFDALRRACEADRSLAAALPAFHLEGPYISAEDGPRGAHPRRHVRRPNREEFRRLQDAAGGRIRLVTLAPEQDGALPFIEDLVKQGVVVALGHTAASGARLGDAVRAGARLSTHLGNGCAAMLPRHENPIWEQLAEEGLWASIICDGQHLTPAVARSIVRVKTPARTILTCDASSLAGLPAGRYREWEQEFEVLPEGKVVVPGTAYLAGSWSFTDHCVAVAMRDTGVTLAEAVDMAGARPRALLGLPERRLEAGQGADLILFDWQPGGPLRVTTTLVASA